MKKITETTLLNSVKSLYETMKVVEADTSRKAATKAIGASENPLGDFQKYATSGVADTFAKDASDWGVDRFGGGVNPAPEKPLGLTNPVEYPDLSPAGASPELPHADLPQHEFNPSDTSYAQDHPPVDDLSGPSDIDKVVPKQPVSGTTHPAGQPKTPKPKFDPAVQKMQYELQAKGYPIQADGILGPKTQQAINWENQSASRDSAIQDFPALQATMDEPVTAPTPDENTQGDFDRMPELNEHVTFSNDDSLARIIQLARG